MIEYLIFCVVAFAAAFGMYLLREYLRSRGLWAATRCVCAVAGTTRATHEPLSL
ncbi:hypothetical protein DJICPGNB_06410 [Escherichia coli]|nr:hypothetical protein DJICPGNB_06410 [Escherichia coli]